MKLPKHHNNELPERHVTMLVVFWDTEQYRSYHKRNRSDLGHYCIDVDIVTEDWNPIFCLESKEERHLRTLPHKYALNQNCVDID